MNLKLVAMALSVGLLSGCSSLVSDSKYPVAIASTPNQASFILKNKDGVIVQSGKTPTSIVLNASSGFFQGEKYTLFLNKEGYAEKTVIIDSSVDGWYFGNIIFGGLIGLLIIDPATGAMFKLPERSDTALDLEAVPENEDDSITVTLIDSIPLSERSSLIQVN